MSLILNTRPGVSSCPPGCKISPYNSKVSILACLTLQWKFKPCQVSRSKDIVEIAKTWPFYGQNMVLTWSFKLVLPQSLSMCPGIFHANFHIAGYILYPFHRNGQKIALLWPKHGPYMVLQIIFSWIIINMPRDAPTQILQFCVYPIVPFS